MDDGWQASHVTMLSNSTTEGGGYNAVDDVASTGTLSGG